MMSAVHKVDLRTLTHVVKHGTQNQGHGGVTEKLEESQTGIGLESPESSLETELDLLTVREGVRGLGRADC
jgi:hypothetical protein